MPYSSSLSTQAHYCLSTQAVTPCPSAKHQTQPAYPASLRFFFLPPRATVSALPPDLPPSSRHNSPGIGKYHRIQVTGACVSPPGLRTSSPRQPGQMPNVELRECSSQPDQLRPHPRRSRPPLRTTATCCPARSPSRTSAPPRHGQRPRREPVARRFPRRPQGQPGFRICPEPWHSTQECRTHSAWPRLSVPTVHARRERWNFHPWPRQARQISCRSSSLRMPPRSRQLVTNPLHSGFSR